MISENEPNNSIATAQAVNLGFDSGEVQTLTISGRISGTPGTTTRARNIDSENNGSITQADETGLVAGRVGSVRDTSVFISTRAPGSSGRDTDLSIRRGQWHSVGRVRRFWTCRFDDLADVAGRRLLQRRAERRGYRRCRL